MTGFSHRCAAWSTILLFSSVASGLGDELRVWTDATGSHTRSAAFLKIEDRIVYLQLDSGTVLRIPMEKLSPADQEFARLAAEKIDSSDPFEAVAEQPASVVVVEGVGVDVASAQSDACREAVRQVVGTFVSPKAAVAQHKAIEEKVVAVSSWLVKKTDPINEIDDGGSVRVRLQAHVRGQQVLELLKAANISTDLLDAERLGSDVLAAKPSTEADRAEALGQPRQPLPADAEPKRIEVFYGTTRVGVEEGGRDIQYGSRSGRLSVGRCYVSIPPLHRVGELESPSILNFEFSPDARKHVILARTCPLQPDQFFAAVRDRAASGSNEAFVFVHGFNVTFDNAARRTAQLAYDLEMDLTPIFFSWPSLGVPTDAAYRSDELSMEIAVPALKGFLHDLVVRTRPDALHIVAHSMGCRLASSALAALASEMDVGQLPAINQIVLAAPDIDAEAFREVIAPNIKQMCRGTTLYVSATDDALAYARRIHGERPRLGDAASGSNGIPGVESVDATGLQTDPLSFGHSYYASVPPVIRDIAFVLRGDSAESRGLKALKSSGEKFWSLPGSTPADTTK